MQQYTTLLWNRVPEWEAFTVINLRKCRFYTRVFFTLHFVLSSSTFLLYASLDVVSSAIQSLHLSRDFSRYDVHGEELTQLLLKNRYECGRNTISSMGATFCNLSFKFTWLYIDIFYVKNSDWNLHWKNKRNSTRVKRSTLGWSRWTGEF